MDELDDQARPVEVPAAGARSGDRVRRTHRLAIVLAVVAVLVIAALAAGLSRDRGHGRDAAAASSHPTRSTARPDCGPAVAAAVCASVLRYARHQANTGVSRPAGNSDDWPTAVTVVAVREHAGTESQPNAGPPCTSGRIVTVDVIGTFDRIGVSPPGLLSGQPVPDYTVDDIVIDSDAKTGRACLSGVKTRENGPTQPPAGATIVYRSGNAARVHGLALTARDLEVARRVATLEIRASVPSANGTPRSPKDVPKPTSAWPENISYVEVLALPADQAAQLLGLDAHSGVWSMSDPVLLVHVVGSLSISGGDGVSTAGYTRARWLVAVVMRSGDGGVFATLAAHTDAHNAHLPTATAIAP